MKILATGDFQLGVGGRLDDQAAVLDRIADVAIESGAELVLNAGDTFEGPLVNPEELDIFARFLARIRAAGIPMLATLGNGRHDRAVRETTGMAIFNHVAGITVAPRPDLYRYDGAVIATLPWVHPGRLVAARNGGDRDEIHADMTAALLSIARGLQQDCFQTDSSVAHILLAHWHIDTAQAANGASVGALFSEPLLPLGELADLGFDAVVLGHNHRGQLLLDDPPIFHVGSPMPHDFGETGFDHGVWLLETDDVDVKTAEFVPIESRPLVTVALDLEHGFDDFAYTELPDGAIVRVRYTATRAQARSLDLPELKRQLQAAGASAVKFMPEIVREDRARVDGVDETLAPLAALDLWIAANEIPEPDPLRARTAHYLEAVAA